MVILLIILTAMIFCHPSWATAILLPYSLPTCPSLIYHWFQSHHSRVHQLNRIVSAVYIATSYQEWFAYYFEFLRYHFTAYFFFIISNSQCSSDLQLHICIHAHSSRQLCLFQPAASRFQLCFGFKLYFNIDSTSTSHSFSSFLSTCFSKHCSQTSPVVKLYVIEYWSSTDD